jgi:phosphoserine phosphatase
VLNDIASLPEFLKVAVLPQLQSNHNPRSQYRGTFTPREYISPIHEVKTEVNQVVNQIDKALKAGKKILLTFDFDGTLTDKSSPDFKVISNLPENVATALNELAAHDQIKVRILTARGHESIRHINLSNDVVRYSSDGLVKIIPKDFDKTEIEIATGALKYLTETENLIASFKEDHLLKKLEAIDVISFAIGLGNLGITISPRLKKHAEKIKKLVKEKVEAIIKDTKWQETKDFQEELNIFYYTNELYNENYENKAAGIRRIVNDLREDDFVPEMLVSLGDSPRSDGRMMEEVNSWNQLFNFFEVINIGVGAKMQGFKDASHNFSNNKDVFEMILSLQNRIK